MERPKVIMHNEVSLDGSIKDFSTNPELFYQIAGRYSAEAHLIGSSTAKDGIEKFMKTIPEEKESDFKKPVPRPDDERPLWVLVDSHGLLKGLLHVYRRFQHCRDIIILVSENTPSDYIEYMKERNYEYSVVGKERVEYTEALKLLLAKYGITTILTDNGGILSGFLLKQNLVDMISILVSPTIVGKRATNLFRSLNIDSNIELKLLKTATFKENHVLLLYKVKKIN